MRLIVYLVESRRQSFLYTSSIFQQGDISTILYHLSVCHNLKITITRSARFRFANGRSVTVIKPITRVADLSLVGPFQLIFVMDRTMAAPSLSAPPIMCNRSIFKEKRDGQSWRREGAVKRTDRTMAERILGSAPARGKFLNPFTLLCNAGITLRHLFVLVTV